MALKRKPLLVFLTSATAAALAGYSAYILVGWIGVGVLGLLVTFITIRMELEGDVPVGSSQNADLYAVSMRDRDGMNPAEKAARNAEIASFRHMGRIAKIIGVTLIMVGIGGFFLIQTRP